MSTGASAQAPKPQCEYQGDGPAPLATRQRQSRIALQDNERLAEEHAPNQPRKRRLARVAAEGQLVGEELAKIIQIIQSI